MKGIIAIALLLAGIAVYLAVSDYTPSSQQAVDSAAPQPEDHFDNDAEIVLGLRVRKDRECTLEFKDYVTPDGDMFSAWSCTPDTPSSPHKYRHYDDATLEIMAWSDADAAALLGQRLIERDTRKSYELLVRATALDNDYRHLTWLADQAFGVVSVDGQPHMGNLGQQYELASVSHVLGDLSGRVEYFRQALIDAGADEKQLAGLDQQVDELLQKLRSIQSTVLGEITIGGQDNA